MISVIDMPPPDESIWWRGKRGFEVGFFPCEYVEVIGDKVPQGLNLPMGANTHHNHHLMSGPAPHMSSSAQHRKDSVSSEDEGQGSPTSEQQPTKPVLRKHGKLISFFRSFILSRPARGKLKKSGILKERVFGCDLSEHLLSQSEQDVPKVLTHCAEFIEAKGIIDGIYRLSGIASNIQKLRVCFDEDRVPNLYDDKAVLQDIHSVSSLLKMYFRELPNPVCTYHLYEKFVEAAKAPENQRLVLMRDVVQQLPPPYYRTLEYLSRHLYRVSLRGNDTGMTAKNVAIVWAPNLLRAKNLETGGVAALQGVGVQAVVTEYLIRYCELIFSDKMPSYNSSSNPSSTNNDTSFSAADRKLRPKSLAISTPTKLLSLEEARQRLGPNGSELTSAQKYIEVGGGPKSLPQKYHTVIDLPSSQRRSMKKSPMGWKAIFKSKTNQNKNGPKNRRIDLINQQNGQAVTDHDLRSAMPRSMLRPVKSAESLVIASNVHRSQSERRSSRTINVPDQTETSMTGSSRPDSMLMEDKDDIGPLEAVSRAIQHRDSPKTHSRSSSHDSYFERQHLLRRGSAEGDDEDNKIMESSLDLSEIQVNFDLEENEMKIFSEDEAMMTGSLDSGSEDLNKSPLEEQPPHSTGTTALQPPVSKKAENSNMASSSSPRKISFREKFKRFTSPTPNRKDLTGLDNTGGNESSSGSGDTPPVLKKAEKTLREKIACALSPESLRKRDTSKLDLAQSLCHQASPKKKKSSFSPGTSPNNTSQLIKRSKIEDDNDEEVPLEDKEIRPEIPLSPSINFIDASMTESFESAKTKGDMKISHNPRFSTASSLEGDEHLQLDQLVVAQVHHDPIQEKRVEEEQESKISSEEVQDQGRVDEVKKADSKEHINEDSIQNTESYSIAGATVSENESFSLASFVEDVEMFQPEHEQALLPPEMALPPTTSLLPTSRNALGNALGNALATTPPSTTTNNELRLLQTTQPSSITSTKITSEAIISEAASMLPANHVIQYSPRLASNNNNNKSSIQWSQRPQQYDAAAISVSGCGITGNPNSRETDVNIHAVQQLEESTHAHNSSESDSATAAAGEPMEVDGVAPLPPPSLPVHAHAQQTNNIELTGTMSCHDSNISCPLYPRETSLVTCAEVQLDHDQNLNIAEEDVDLKGHIVLATTAGPNATQEPAAATPAAAADDSTAPTTTTCGTDVTPTTVMTTSPEPRPRTKSFVTTTPPNSNHPKICADMADNGNPKILRENEGSNPKRTPVPTPRKSVTLMEVEPPVEPASSNAAAGAVCSSDNSISVSGCITGGNNPNSRETNDQVIAIANAATTVLERSQSAQGGDSISAATSRKQISFGGILSNCKSNPKKLSTFSLHTVTSELVSEAMVSGEDMLVPEDVPLQRRNSIHNVPYVDVNDPSTRERMERYKEERRSLLRAKYKVEDYMTNSTSEANNKYRRKSTESNSNDHENNSSSTSVSDGITGNPNSRETVVQLRKENHPTTSPAKINENTKTDEPPPPPSTTGSNIININKNNSSSTSVSGNNPNPNSRETGLIDEDVNVKERAAIFGITTSKNTNNTSSTSTKKNNRSKSWNMSTTTTTTANSVSGGIITGNSPNSRENINNKNNEIINKRPISSESHATNHRKLSPGSPSKIRDMAALFEQKN